MSESEFNKIFSTNLNNQLYNHNITQAQLAKVLGVSTSTVSYWCQGIKTPRMDKVDAICSYFNITRSDLMEDPKNRQESYYINNDAKELAQFLYDNPEYKVLFDATKNVKKEDIEFVKQMLDRFRNQ